ncbi:organic solute transporter subunit beta [Odontesthes bonariensis]
MTEEQREYLRWYYRTEDPTTWRFVLLGLAFICLLIGFLLLGMGAMANKSRKKIAKYKAAASFINKNENEALQINSPLRDNGASPQHGGVLQGHMSSMDTSELKAGDIVVTWKDGNTSCLYSDRVEEDKQEEEQEETEEKEVPDAEQETHDGVTMTE